MRDAFIRPYIGDVLAIALVYTALRALTPLSLYSALGLTLAIAVAIEIAQAMKVLDALGLGGNEMARTIFGGSFDWMDLVAYAVGGIVVILVELAAPGKDA